MQALQARHHRPTAAGRQAPGVVMRTQGAEQALPAARRREVFRLLVTAQDLEMTVVESRRIVMERCGLTERQVIQIEREGLVGQWPPL
jgi:hypothetical protein